MPKMRSRVTFCMILTCLMCASPDSTRPSFAQGSFDSPAPAPSPLLGGAPDTGPGEESVFDVLDYGAIPDGKTENSKAFLAAWDAACGHSGASTFIIPEDIESTYFVGPISFAGPCYGSQSPAVKIEGVLLAPADIDAFPNSIWIEFKDLNDLLLTGKPGSTKFDAQGGVQAWKQTSCSKSDRCSKLITSLKFSNVSYGNISNMTVVNSKGFHVSFNGCDNIDVQNITITAPGDSPNTDGIHISQSKNITVTSSTIGVGDDCISIGPGSVNVSISDIHCGPGHGISVGSLGKYKDEEDVVGIRVENCSINGTQNGLRIKTWPGSPASSAYNISYSDIVMSNVSNPIIIDQEYCPKRKCDVSQPSLVKLGNISFKNINGSYNSPSAVTLLCSPAVPCQNISLADINLTCAAGNGAGQAQPFNGAGQAQPFNVRNGAGQAQPVQQGMVQQGFELVNVDNFNN